MSRRGFFTACIAAVTGAVISPLVIGADSAAEVHGDNCLMIATVWDTWTLTGNPKQFTFTLPMTMLYSFRAGNIDALGRLGPIR